MRQIHDGLRPNRASATVPTGNDASQHSAMTFTEPLAPERALVLRGGLPA